MLITKEQARRQLPELGERRMETPTVDETHGIQTAKKPRECVVVYINPVNLWYTVQFKIGVRESYKVPHLKPAGGGRNV